MINRTLPQQIFIFSTRGQYKVENADKEYREAMEKWTVQQKERLK